jgi:hypothetical protein
LSNGEFSLAVKSNYENFYQIDKEGNDFRFDEWFKSGISHEADGLRCIKLVDFKRMENLSRPEVNGINIIRLPEMYYIAAEALLSTDAVKATEYLDKVVESRGLDSFSGRVTNNIVTLQNIINERRKELICEGQYFYTMKRYNLDVLEGISGEVFPASNEIYVLPVPDQEYEYRK